MDVKVQKNLKNYENELHLQGMIVKEEKILYATSMLLSKAVNLFKKGKSIDYKQILVVKLDEIGDMVTSLHVFAELKRSYPEATITLWCKAFIVPLIKNDPNIDRIITSKEELTGSYDLHIDLRGNWDSIFYSLKHWPKYRLDRGAVRLRNKYKTGQLHEVDTNLEIIEPVLKLSPAKPVLKLYLSAVDEQKAAEFIQENKLSQFAVFHTGARRELRKWKASNYVALANWLKEEKGLDIIFGGDKNDREDITHIQSLIPFKTYSTAGELSLVEFAALLSKASLFIGNESGPMHIASAVNIPVIGLFGPGVPIVFYPYGKKSRYLHHVLSCNPCDQIHCVQPENPCINLIEVEDVKVEIVKLLNGAIAL